MHTTRQSNPFSTPSSKLVTHCSVLKFAPAIITAIIAFIVVDQAFALTATQGATIVQIARSKIETAYKLPPDGFPKNTDCSLLTQFCYQQAGITIPRTAAQQYGWCTKCSNQPGSLLFFWTDDTRPGVVTHVGINLGNGKMINANSKQGKVVEEQWQGNAYWQRRLVTSGTR